jgi:hypothetical protein
MILRALGHLALSSQLSGETWIQVIRIGSRGPHLTPHINVPRLPCLELASFTADELTPRDTGPRPIAISARTPP